MSRIGQRGLRNASSLREMRRGSEGKGRRGNVLSVRLYICEAQAIRQGKQESIRAGSCKTKEKEDEKCKSLLSSKSGFSFPYSRKVHVHLADSRSSPAEPRIWVETEARKAEA